MLVSKTHNQTVEIKIWDKEKMEIRSGERKSIPWGMESSGSEEQSHRQGGQE